MESKNPNKTIEEAIHGWYVEFKAVSPRLTDPPLWAEWTYNPFYVDNRMLQYDPFAREAIRQGLAATIDKRKVIDYVYGIPSAGIAPATLLARELHVPLLIQYNDEYYTIDLANVEKFLWAHPEIMRLDTDMIAGTVPFGIIFGLVLAEIKRKPFVFVRKEAKDHGKQQQIEGIYKDGDHAILISPYFDEEYTQEAKTALGANGVSIDATLSAKIFALFEKVTFFEGKNIISVEDLISSGKSMIQKIKPLLKKGASMSVRSIFNYRLPKSQRNFANIGLEVISLVCFENLKAYLYDHGFLTDNQCLALDEWFLDQPNWGVKHGFIPPPKK